MIHKTLFTCESLIKNKNSNVANNKRLGVSFTRFNFLSSYTAPKPFSSIFTLHNSGSEAHSGFTYSRGAELHTHTQL